MKAAAEPSAKADRPGVGLACALTLAVFAFGLACQPRDDAAPAPPRSARAPGTPVSIGLELNGVIHSAAPPIVVPPSGFVINATWPRLEGAHARLRLFDARGATRELAHVLGLSGDGAGRIVPADQAFAVGPAQLVLEFEEASGTLHRDAIAFEVAEFPGARAPIGHGQWIWFDFTADRDATPGPDFEADLVAFGLLSPTASPGLRAHVRQRVIDTALDRVRSVYASSNPSRVDGADAVAVSFGEHDPRVTDTTRICVGGADPSGGTSIGHVKLDPGNRRRRETLCGPQPPGGIYPRELLTYAGQTAFRAAFDPLRPEVGGTPIGAHPLDAALLEPRGAHELDAALLEPRSAHELDAELLEPGHARGRVVDHAIEAFGAALGSVLAHETGHALGLVPPELGGGTRGEAYAHNPIDPGTREGAFAAREAEPVKFLMDAGRGFEFADLVGRPGEGWRPIRALNHAYLRDRVVLVGAADPPAR